jgi:hypothetical protein
MSGLTVRPICICFVVDRCPYLVPNRQWYQFRSAARHCAKAGGQPVSKLNPTQTLITSPENVPWKIPDAAPPDSVAEAVLAGGEEQDGAYIVLMKWYPGWMSAPHTYATDRLCVVISGVWWCNSGPDFDPAEAVPVHPGGFVRRVAGTPHHDGARADAAEPAVIAVSGGRTGQAGLGGPVAASTAAGVSSG